MEITAELCIYTNNHFTMEWVAAIDEESAERRIRRTRAGDERVNGETAPSDRPAPPNNAPQSAPPAPKLENLTPAQIVAELDKYIIGQNEAKRAVAVALRNRYRRQLLAEQLRREVQPKNILMIGPTGVGKTEVARRVARLVDAPFIKVEATKFTEVGYVGRDVESIIRDLVEVAISDLHSSRLEQVNDRRPISPPSAGRSARRSDDPKRRPRRHVAKQVVETQRSCRMRTAKRQGPGAKANLAIAGRERARGRDGRNRDRGEDDFGRVRLLNSADDLGPDDMLRDCPGRARQLLPRRSMRRRVSVREARRILTQQEANRLVDFDAVVDEAIQRAEDPASSFSTRSTRLSRRTPSTAPTSRPKASSAICCRSSRARS